MVELFHYATCAASRAVRLTLHELNVDFDLVEIKPWEISRDFLELNPAGTTPVLLVSGKAVCSAFAIVEYLSETLAQSAKWGPWPGTPMERAEARRVADWFLRKFESEVSVYLTEEKVLKPMSGQRHVPDLHAIRAARDNLRYHLSYLSYLADRRKWLGGDYLSFADFAAAGQLSAMDYLGEIAWSDAPEAKIWYERIKSRPAMRPLLADRIPGLSPPMWYGDLDF